MFLAKLSLQSLRKNQQIYLPFLIAMTFMVAINTMIQLLVHNQGMNIEELRGLKYAFGLGQIVIVIFTLIFSIYSNRFLIKHRLREFGLYNVLGLGKAELYRLSCWELFYSLLLSLSAGLVAGFVFFKLGLLVLGEVLGVDEVFQVKINFSTILTIVVEFLLIYSLLLLLNCWSIYKTNPIDLLLQSRKGEKEPKSRKLVTIIGIVVLATGYGIALSIRSPLAAIFLFFVAVVLVIIGTYLLFISGSITLLKFLKNKPAVYYRPRSFVAISGMLYRMKHHAAGLASICILATMVLITVAVTASLYFGRQTDLEKEYDYDVSYMTSFDNQRWIEETYKFAEAEDVQITNTFQLKTTGNIPYHETHGVLEWTNVGSVYDLNDIQEFSSSTFYTFITLEEYNRVMKSAFSLEEDQILVDGFGLSFKEKQLVFTGEQIFHVKKVVKDFPVDLTETPTHNSFLVVLANQELVDHLVQTTIPKVHRGSYFAVAYRFGFDFIAEDEQRAVFADQLDDRLKAIGSDHPAGYTFSYQARDLVRESYDYFDSSFFFIGMLLSIVFMLATTLIIYFKQISEGLDDRERFIIMQKVGMSRQEVKQTIRQQILLVFSLPLVTAFIHLTFAFPMMKKLLLLFDIKHTQVFITATIVVAAVFTLLYLLVYWLTARAYYQLVERDA